MLINVSINVEVHKYVDYILEHQSSDGWLGPEDDKDGNMYWSKFPMMLALLQVLYFISLCLEFIPLCCIPYLVS